MFQSFRIEAQVSPLNSIKGLPTKEIYDLLVDKKGFLWIGHDLGLSRFDGISFVDFHCQDQMSLSVTDLVEDSYGRIWCHNFNGQIFYAENEKLHLLKDYIFEKEARFPRIVLFDDELVATSSKGLFVCNIKTLKSKYIFLNKTGYKTGTTSLAISKKQLIAYGHGKWFSYQKNKPVKQLLETDKPIGTDDFYLHPIVYKDTIYVTSTFAGHFRKFILKGDSVCLVKTEKANRFVNTISLQQNQLWINTKTDSYTTDNKNLVPGLNLTDIVTDHEGNTWYGSLKNGLMVKYKSDGFRKNNFLQLEKNDFVRSITKQGNFIASGTQNGEIILFDTNLGKTVFKKKLYARAGSIEKISNFTNNNFMVSASVGNWVLNINKNELMLFSETTSKDNDIYHDLFFDATANYIGVRPVENAGYDIESLRQKYFPSLATLNNKYGTFLAAEERCRALKYDSLNQTIYAALKNGLYTVNKAGTLPVMYQGHYINASSIAYAKGLIYVGDFNKGLMIIKGKSIKNVSIEDGLLSNTILKIKAYNNHLYIIGEKGLQIYDIKEGEVNEEIQLPSLEQGIVYDVLEFNNTALIATSDGIYEMALNSRSGNKTFNNYFQYAIINNTDTVTNASVTLPYNKNNIQIRLSVPWFNNPQQIYFKYRLINSNNSDWELTRQGERSIQYAALMPGNYSFEALATAPNGKFANKAVKFNFIITKPWWQQLWFMSLVFLLGCGIIVLTVRSYYVLRLRKERALFKQQLAVEFERQRIGSEIHDDIGAGLSALRLYTGLVEGKISDQHLKADISKIYASISLLSAQIREVIWTLNTDHDSLENLVYYLQQQATDFFENTAVKLKFDLPEIIPDRKISGEKRRNIYLALKEGFQNIIKHSKATAVFVTIQFNGNSMTISVADDGIGLSQNATVESCGVGNMKNRIKTTGGSLFISSEKGTTLIFNIPV